ncbi:MAG: sulfurtransferase complex subunit TusB [Rhodospirillales bacterium]|nr:sulfurtransferase complex subunit TusB [Rhodospirillales bacterium]
MSLLHTVAKSPFERDALASCLALSLPGAAILLYEDGVYGALKGGRFAERLVEAAKTRALYVLGPDLKARGLGEDKLIAGVTVVDYRGFVDLAAKHQAVQAWC